MQNVMLGSLNLYEAFAFFFLYAFLGWVAEIVFHAVTAGRFVNRGFLNGPVCPIYGVGVVAILLVLGDYVRKPWAVFLVGIAFPTLIELITGWALEKFFRNKWWDYSTRKCNLGGYICLEFSVLWGLAVLFVVEIVHPLIAAFAHLFGNIAGTVLVSAALAALAADCVVTVLQILKLNRKLKEIDAVASAMRKGSELIGEKLAVAAIGAEEGLKRAQEAAWEKRSRTIDAIVKKMPRRLLNAFPNLASRLHPDAVALARDSMRRTAARRRKEKKNK